MGMGFTFSATCVTTLLPTASGNLGDSNDDFGVCSTSRGHHLGGDSRDGELDARTVVIPVTSMGTVLMMELVLGLAVLGEDTVNAQYVRLNPSPTGLHGTEMAVAFHLLRSPASGWSQLTGALWSGAPPSRGPDWKSEHCLL